MTGDKKKDQDLDQYLEGRDGLSQKYHQVSAESPPHNIDEAILASSRKAVSAKPTSVIAPFSSRWHVPMSVAAVVVLSVLVVISIPEYTSEIRYEPAFDISEMESPGKRASDETDNNDMFKDQQMPDAAVPSDTQSTQSSGRLELSKQSLNQPQISVSKKIQSSSVPESATVKPAAEINNIQTLTAPAAVENFSSNDSIIVEDRDLQLRQRVISPDENRILTREVESVRGQSVDTFEKKESIAETVLDSAEEIPLQAISRAIEIPQQAEFIECTLPRPQVCTFINMPVCAVRDTGIRCVTTPCNSTERINYANACSACSDPNVLSYTDGVCADVSE